MSLDMIKELKGQVEAMKQELEASKTEAEKIREEVKEASAQRKRDFTAEVQVSDAELAKAKKGLESVYLQSKILGRDMKEIKGFSDFASVIEKAVVPSDLTNWAAEEFSNNVIEALELELMVANLFKTIQMPVNRQTLSIPARTANLSAYLIAPAADAVASQIDDGKVSFTVKKMMAASVIADEADAELVAAVTDLTRAELVRALARGQEDACINGDTAFATANSPKKMFNGLRKIGNANSVDMGGVGITVAKINATRKAMGIHGINVNSLVLIVNPEVYFTLVGLPEFLTVDKYGSAATIMNGEVGKIFGIPVVVTSYIANNLETTGADHVTTGATTEALLVNKDYFAWCTRGGITLETDRTVINQTNTLVSSRSLDFKAIYTSGKPIAALVNVLP